MKILIIYLLFTIYVLGQTNSRLEVVDNNTFKILETGRLVHLSDLHIPSIKDSASDLEMKKLADKIYLMLQKYISNDYFEITFVGTMDKVRLRKSGVERDLAYQLLLEGYAVFTGNRELPNSAQYAEAEKTARESKIGIWALNSDILSKQFESYPDLKYKPKVNTSQTNNIIKIPHKEFLVVSALSLLFAWDSFSQASDLGDLINQNDKLGIKEGQDDLKTQRTRKTVIGVIATGLCLASLIVSFNDFEIKASPGQINLSYKF